MPLSLGVSCYAAIITSTVDNSHREFVCKGEKKKIGVVTEGR